MIDDNKEDEYQFTELDGEHSFDEDMSMDEVTTSFPSENNVRKIILSGLAVVIIGFVLFKFVSSYFSSKDGLGSENLAKKSPQKPAIVAKPALSKTKPIVKVHKPIEIAAPKPFIRPEPRPYVQPAKPVQVVTQTVNDPKISSNIEYLKRSSQKSSRKILRINNNVASIRDSIDALSSKIGSLNATIASLSSKVTEQQIQLDALKPKTKKVSTKQAKKKNKISYHVKALIPGRGWLMSSQGVTVTVVKGTLIPGYGRVKSIDARHGKVMMTSGTVIGFTVSDT